MDKQAAVISYKTSMSVFRKWLADDVISPTDLSAIETKLAEKYELSSGSIYRENDLLCSSKRVINRVTTN